MVASGVPVPTASIVSGRNGNCVKFTTVVSNTAEQDQRFNLTLVANKRMKISFWYKVENHNADGCNVIIVYDIAGGGQGIGMNAMPLLATSTSWTYLEQYFTVPSNSAGTGYIDVPRHGTIVASQNTYIDDLYIGTAETWTDLSPNQLSYTLLGWTLTTIGNIIVLYHSAAVTTDSAYIRSTNIMTHDVNHPKYAFAEGNFTIEFWGNLTTTPTDGSQECGSAFSVNSDGTSNGTMMQLNHSYNGYPFRDIGAGRVYGTACAFNTWAQYVFQVGPNSGTPSIAVYKNGVLNDAVGTGSTQTTWTKQTSNAYHYLMRDLDDLNNFAGYVSMIRMYNRVLSAAEILQNYNALKGRFGL